MATANPLLTDNDKRDPTSFETTSKSDERVKSIEEDANGATAFSCFVNLANTILGSGILGLPYAFSKCGWVIGTVLLIVCGSLSAFALHCLAMCALREPQQSTFYSVAHAAMPKLTTVIDVAVAIKCFGVATSYLVVIGDLMPEVMEQMGAPDRAASRILWVAVGFSLVVPLSFLRSLDSLKFTSLLSLFFVGFLTFLIMLYSTDAEGLDPCTDLNDDECIGDTSNFIFDVETMKVLSIFVFGFTCHQNIFAVKNEIQRPSSSRIDAVIIAAIGMAGVMYLMVGCFGYKTYGANVESDILVNYPSNGLTSTARLFVSLLVAFSYPLQAHPARKCILTLLATCLDEGKSVEPPYAVLRLRFIVITVIFLAASFLIAMATSDLGVVLSLVGATGSTIVSYILPGFVYYLTFKDEESSPKWKIMLALFQGCLGLIIMPVCLTFIFL